MPFGFGFGPGRAAQRRGASTPASIFGANLRVWFDNQDLSTMWQDVAMTTPAAVGQPVAMQRCKVNPATFYRSQATTAQRPILRQTAGGVYYLECDGVDDGLETPTIDFSNTDALSVFAGLRKLTAVGTTSPFMELSANVDSNRGFAIFAPSSGTQYMFKAIGGVTASTTSAGFAAPHTAVLTGLDKIGTDTCVLRVNGAQVGTAATDQGAGNFGNYPLYYFRRGGVGITFNGWDFGSFIVDRLASDTEMAAAETYLNRFVGAY